MAKSCYYFWRETLSANVPLSVKNFHENWVSEISIVAQPKLSIRFKGSGVGRILSGSLKPLSTPQKKIYQSN